MFTKALGTFIRIVFAPFLSAEPLIFLTYFNIMCEQHHSQEFTAQEFIQPIFISVKNLVKNVTCKSGFSRSTVKIINPARGVSFRGRFINLLINWQQTNSSSEKDQIFHM